MASKSGTSRKRKLSLNVDNPPAKHTVASKDNVKKSSKISTQQTTKSRQPSRHVNSIPTTKLEVFVFGDNSSGVLGLGPDAPIEVARPRLNSNLTGVVNIATGGMHAAALTDDNKVLTWGVNDNGALGRDTTWDGGLKDMDAEESGSEEGMLNPKEATPTVVSLNKVIPAGIKVVQTAATNSATFILTEDGKVYGWGTFVSDGKPGFHLKSNYELVEKQKEPTLIPHLENIKELSAGSDFCLALNADGDVFSWGMCEQGQLGRRVVVNRRIPTKYAPEKLRNYVGLIPSPVGLPKRTKIASIHTGCDHAFAIDTNNNTWAWGLNNFTQTGIVQGAGTSGATIMAPQKVPALAGKNLKTIVGGSHHSACVTKEGECLVWGRIDGARTGFDVDKLAVDYPDRIILQRGAPRILIEPTALPIPPCSYVTVGSVHAVSITQEGKAYSWGENVDYRCGVGSDDLVPVSTQLGASSIRDKKLSWAGAGGGYSVLASPL